MKPKVSIILPIRNRAKLFKASLDSYAAQAVSHDEFELIIIDQQSDDGLVDLLKDYNSLNFKLYDIDVNSGTIKPNMFGGLTNPALPQNFGVKQASGDIIVLTSPETVFANTNITTIIKDTKEHTFTYGHVVDAKHYEFDRFDIDYLKQIDGKEYCGPNKHPRTHPWVYFIGVMLKSDFIKLGGIEELFMLGIGCDDTEFGMRVQSAGFKILYHHGIFGIHQSHTKMETDKDREERIVGLAINRSTYYVYFPDRKFNDRHMGNVGREFGVAGAKLISSSVSPHQLTTIEPQPIRRPNNVMLHVNQAFWRGGSILSMRDISKAYPEFHHITCFFYDSREDFKMTEEFRYEGIEVCQIDKLTPEIVERIDPVVMVFHNTEGKTVDGEWPYDWLKRWPLIAMHHNRSHPCFNADLDIFVSEDVLRHYEKQKPRMNWKLIPPCIDLSVYEKIPRSPDNSRCVIGKLTSKYPTRYPTELIDILHKVQSKVSCEVVLVGGADFYKDVQLDNCTMPPVGSKTPERFYRGFDIFVHRNKEGTTDSWGRVISEAMASGLPVVCENKGGPAEQITHGEDGFLCDNDDEFVEHLVKLASDPQLRYEIGMRARETSVEFGIYRFRAETIDVVLKAAMGTI